MKLNRTLKQQRKDLALASMLQAHPMDILGMMDILGDMGERGIALRPVTIARIRQSYLKYNMSLRTILMSEVKHLALWDMKHRYLILKTRGIKPSFKNMGIYWTMVTKPVLP